MSYCRFGAMMIVTAGIGFATQSLGADLNHLPQGQRQTAQCMVSVLGDLAEVTKPRLVLIGRPEQRVLLTYDYRSHADGRVHHQKLNITGIVTHPEQFHFVTLGGLPPPGGDLDDADSGMLRITKLWKSRCGLRLEVQTV